MHIHPRPLSLPLSDLIRNQYIRMKSIATTTISDFSLSAICFVGPLVLFGSSHGSIPIQQDRISLCVKQRSEIRIRDRIKQIALSPRAQERTSTLYRTLNGWRDRHTFWYFFLNFKALSGIWCGVFFSRPPSSLCLQRKVPSTGSAFILIHNQHF